MKKIQSLDGNKIDISNINGGLDGDGITYHTIRTRNRLFGGTKSVVKIYCDTDMCCGDLVGKMRLLD